MGETEAPESLNTAVFAHVLLSVEWSGFTDVLTEHARWHRCTLEDALRLLIKNKDARALRFYEAYKVALVTWRMRR